MRIFDGLKFGKKYSKEEIELMMDTADEQLKSGDLSSASRIYEKVIHSRKARRDEIKDLSIAAFGKLYNIKYNLYPLECLDFLEKEININPRNEEAYRLLIDYFKGRDEKLEIKYSESYFQDNRRSPLALNYYLEALMYCNREKVASKFVKDFERKIDRKTNEAQIYELIDYHFKYYSDHGRARKLMTKLDDILDEKGKRYWYYCAKIGWEESNGTAIHMSLENLDNALKFDDKYIEALLLRAEILIESGRVIRARDIYRRVLRLDPENDGVKELLIEINNTIEEMKEQEKMMYSFIDPEQMSRTDNIVTLQTFSNKMITDRYSISNLNNKEASDFAFLGSNEQEKIIEKMKRGYFSEALSLIERDSTEEDRTVRINWLKGLLLVLQGEFRSAQDIDDKFWKISPNSLSEEILMSDFSGLYVNIEDELDHYNRKSNELGVSKRFTFKDLGKVELNEISMNDAISFLKEPSEDGFLGNIKPRVKEHELLIFEKNN